RAAGSRHPDRGAGGLAARAVKRAALLLCIGCASALHKPPPIESIAAAPRTGAAQLLTEAEAAWARRAEPGQAAAAEDLYLQAARADPSRPESFAGAIRAKAFRLGREKDGAERLRLAQGAVQVGQLCEQNAPAAPEAQAAVRIAPDFPPNQLALGEALRKHERVAEARSAYSKALRLATDGAAQDDPDAAGWAEEARAALREVGIRHQASSATVT